LKFSCALSFIQPDALMESACVAEEYGFDSIQLADHVVNPDVVEARHPLDETGERPWTHETPWPDVWVATGMMAAVTTRIRFTQTVFIAAMREPFGLAKAIGTCARMSGNRISLGIGLGWMRDEFELLGQNFEDRGGRTDELIEVLRKLWTGDLVEHHGPHYDFPPLTMTPGVGSEVPVYIGGDSKLAMKRVARLGDGWLPAYLSIDQVREGLEFIRNAQREYGRADHPLTVLTSCHDAKGVDDYRRMEEIGVTHITLTPWRKLGEPLDYRKLIQGAPLAEIKDGIRRYADEIISKF
jgi:probable F420-dependent oxidoreductase